MASTKTAAKRPSSRTPAKSSRAGSPKTPPKVSVVVSAAMRGRYERLLAAFKRAQGAELVQWDAAYEAIDAILSAEPPLYLAGGFKSARAFADAVLPGITLDTIRDNARVARYFDPPTRRRSTASRASRCCSTTLRQRTAARSPRCASTPSARRSCRRSSPCPSRR
jgi:hypothetical protein